MLLTVLLEATYSCFWASLRLGFGRARLHLEALVLGLVASGVLRPLKCRSSRASSPVFGDSDPGSSDDFRWGRPVLKLLWLRWFRWFGERRLSVILGLLGSDNWYDSNSSPSRMVGDRVCWIGACWRNFFLLSWVIVGKSSILQVISAYEALKVSCFCTLCCIRTQCWSLEPFQPQLGRKARNRHLAHPFLMALTMTSFKIHGS